MKYQNIDLIREQLDITLKKFAPLKSISPPPKGWIRAIRNALGMSGQQLANRLGVNKQRVSRIEKDEIEGRVTINTLRKIANALDCEFVYGFVPHASLENTLESQAKKIAQERMDKVFHTMSLEQQGLSAKNKKKAIEHEAKVIITNPSSAWND